MIVPHIEIYEDGSLTYMARVLGAAGTAIVRADVTAIAYKSWDLTNNELANADTLATDIVYNSLQTGDPRWTNDSAGFNFLSTLGAANFPQPRHEYNVQWHLTMADGTTIHLECVPKTRKVF